MLKIMEVHTIHTANARELVLVEVLFTKLTSSVPDLQATG